MKRYFVPTLVTVLAFFIMLCLPSILPGNNRLIFKDASVVSDKWEKLAAHKIDLSSNSDVVPVTAGSPYTAIKIRALKGGLNLHRCDIYFKDGSKTTIQTRNDIAPGSESRIIALPSDNGNLAKVVVWYDTINYPNQKPEIEIWGRNP